MIIVSLSHWAAISVAALPRCLWNFRAIGEVLTRISLPQDFTRSCGKMSVSLTHWGRVTHRYIINLTIIGSDNGLSPGRRQAIIWTKWILLIGPLGTNFSERLIEVHTFWFKKIYVKISSAEWPPICLGLNVLMNRCPAYFCKHTMGFHLMTCIYFYKFPHWRPDIWWITKNPFYRITINHVMRESFAWWITCHLGQPTRFRNGNKLSACRITEGRSYLCRQYHGPVWDSDN